jgi:hypothetical protein
MSIKTDFDQLQPGLFKKVTNIINQYRFKVIIS